MGQQEWAWCSWCSKNDWLDGACTPKLGDVSYHGDIDTDLYSRPTPSPSRSLSVAVSSTASLQTSWDMTFHVFIWVALPSSESSQAFLQAVVLVHSTEWSWLIISSYKSRQVKLQKHYRWNYLRFVCIWLAYGKIRLWTSKEAIIPKQPVMARFRYPTLVPGKKPP